MIKQMIAIYDNKAQFFSMPVCHVNNEEAKRLLHSAVNDERSPYAKHPEDYQAFLMGTFDDCKGTISPIAPPEMLWQLSTFKFKDTP